MINYIVVVVSLSGLGTGYGTGYRVLLVAMHMCFNSRRRRGRGGLAVPERNQNSSEATWYCSLPNSSLTGNGSLRT